MENTTQEIWKDVTGYEGYYQVSNLGKVRSLDRIDFTKSGIKKKTRGRILNLTIKSNFYLSVMFSVKGNKKRFHVHRLVAKAFIPNPENKPEVNHKKGLKNDNRASELEWITIVENKNHAYKIGLSKNGEESVKSKLTKQKVLAIRRLYKINPNFNKLELSKKLNVSDSTIHKIIRNNRWKHI